MKLIIAGSRGLKITPEQIYQDLHELGVFGVTEVISGMARNSPDISGVQLAQLTVLPCTKMPANWKEIGKSAGFVRNAEMAFAGDALLAYWDMKSKGTKHMIDTMIAKRKPVWQINVGPDGSTTTIIHPELKLVVPIPQDPAPRKWTSPANQGNGRHSKKP